MKYDIPKEFKQFVAHVKRKCKTNGVELVLSPSKNVVLTDSFSTDCSGYFDETDKILVVACGKPFDEWVEILVHEYSHMEQWLYDDRYESWANGCIQLWDWLDKSLMLNTLQLKKVIESMVELEGDCEKRSLENIRKWKLPINKSNYSRKANLYLYSYLMMPIIKKFPTGIYDHIDLVMMCPNRLLKKVKEVPKPIQDEIIKLYLK